MNWNDTLVAGAGDGAPIYQSAQPAAGGDSSPWSFGGSNPYAGAFGSSIDSAVQGIPQIQQNISNLQSQQKNNYPSYPNQYGLGNQKGSSQEAPFQATQNTASNPGYLSSPLNSQVTDSASRGFNPWSLQGEANSRGN